MKYLIIPLLLMVSAVSLSGQPVSIWIWDNDMGAVFPNPDIPFPTPLDTIGCERFLLTALVALGYQVVYTPTFIPPDPFDAVFITNGWREPIAGIEPGIIDPSARMILKQYMDIGKPVVMDGGDIAWTYLGLPASPNYDPDFMYRYFGCRLVDDGQEVTLDSLFGMEGTAFEGLKYFYAPHNVGGNTGPRSSVDIIDSTNAYGISQPIFLNYSQGKIVYYRACAYSSFYKDVPHRAILFSFVLSACQDLFDKNGKQASTKLEILRHSLQFLSQNSAVPSLYPAPPSGLQAAGLDNCIRLSWHRHPDPMIDNYILYRSQVDTLNFLPLISLMPLDTLYFDSTAVIGDNYFYFLKANIGPDTSRRSEYVQASPTGVIINHSDTNQGLPIITNINIQGNSLSFALHKPSLVYLALYDVIGRQKYQSHSCLSPGNHRMSLPQKTFTTGLYFVRVSAGEISIVKKYLILR